MDLQLVKTSIVSTPENEMPNLILNWIPAQSQLLPFELWAEIVSAERTSFENFTMLCDKPCVGWGLIEIKG